MSGPAALEAVHRYHDGTKHHFGRFARSVGYLDWASQPKPFRSFDGAPCVPLYPHPDAPPDRYRRHVVAYPDLSREPLPAHPLSAAALGDLLRHSLGLSAWKELRGSRWALRVNPSSGNLHPTEAYVVCGALPGLDSTAGVYHYAPDRHLLERRCAFDAAAWADACGTRTDMVLIAFTSIHWRESWKYGERAFRYCQHDLGHALAAVALAATLAGWRAEAARGWSHGAIAGLTGIDRDEDFTDAEREEPGCLLAITAAESPAVLEGSARLIESVRRGRWTGRASQLSADHVQWTFIDEIAQATEDPGRPSLASSAARQPETLGVEVDPPTDVARQAPPSPGVLQAAHDVILQRRSALGFDGASTIARSVFFDMLRAVVPSPDAWWQALWWAPRVHLALFVHRVDDVPAGLYVLAREEGARARLEHACGRAFEWEAADPGGTLPLWRLARGDCRALARRLSCDQDIASDGFFSLGMIAELDGALAEHGVSFYRHLFWETGVVGQILYLEAEAAGARATGIGCFYDDPVHDVLGLHGHAFQSLYHFTIGRAVDDTRLTTEPGYPWEIS